MKRKIFLLTIIFCVTIACDNLLDVTPESVLTTASMWDSEEDAKGALNGMMSQFRTTFSTQYARWGDCRAGHLWEGPYNSPQWLVPLRWNALTRESEGTDWTQLYRTINDANLILKYVPDIDFRNENDKNFILGNAYFIRAFCYYWIARLWGDAPIQITPIESAIQEDLYPSREPVENLFTRIEDDIKNALELFSDDNIKPKGIYGSRAATNMLKADFYLWLAKVNNKGNNALSLAKTAVDEVLANPNLRLSDNYEDVFRDELNIEIIFAINLDIDEATGGFPTYFLTEVGHVFNPDIIENPVPVQNGAQWVSYAEEFILFLYEKDYDTRAEVNFYIYYDPVKNQLHRWINKFRGQWINETRYFTSNIRLYRYAEAILFKAEIENALGNTGEALLQLNKIAKRAYKIENYYQGLNSDEIDAAIIDERLREFGSTEGKTWWDYVRFGVAFEKVEFLRGRESEQNILRWPVSSSSLNTNPNIKQTPGY